MTENAPTIPGPTPADMLRHARRMRTDPLGYLLDVSERHGALVEFPIPTRRVVFANSPDLVQAILQTGHRSHDRQTIQYRSLALVTGQGLLTSDGDSWRRQRRLMQPAFHRAVLNRLVRHIDLSVDRLADGWDRTDEGAIVDVDAAMMHTALDVVGRSLFSHDLSGDAERLVGAVLSALDVVVAKARSPLPLPTSWPTPANRRLHRSLEVLDTAVEAMIRERRAAQAATVVDPDDDSQDRPDADLLGMLLAANDLDDGHFDDQQVRDEVVTLIVAGHETVASALTWTWHLLAQSPEVEQRLHAEVDSVLGGRRASFADLPQLTYTRQIIDEALRLYPPAWLISRRTTEPVEFDGHDIDEGAYVFVSPYVLHRSPAVWDNPDTFDPDRFAPGVTVDRFAYIPFGAGPSLCIGRDFALLEAVLIVATLASRYQLTSAPGRSVHAEPLVTIRPRDGLPMVLHHRQPRSS